MSHFSGPSACWLADSCQLLSGDGNMIPVMVGYIGDRFYRRRYCPSSWYLPKREVRACCSSRYLIECLQDAVPLLDLPSESSLNGADFIYFSWACRGARWASAHGPGQGVL